MRRLLFSTLVALCLSLILTAVINRPVSADDAPETQTYKLYLPLIGNTGTPPTPVAVAPAAPTFDSFAASVTNGQAAVVTGVYVDGVLALSIVQQPLNNATYVSAQAKMATQFAMATQFGVTGLLAHNWAAGAEFFNLAVGQEVKLVYGDGHYTTYVIRELARFQALQPTNPSSDFIDLQTNASVTALEVFSRFYTLNGQLVFQTCIANQGNGSWGRLFVVAEAQN